MAPYLSNLGISEELQRRTPEAMPSTFNTSNIMTWRAAVAETKMVKDMELNWVRVIKRYIEICMAENRYPFGTARQSVNDAIFNHLLKCRRDIVKFINASEILTKCQLREVVRACKVTPRGFTIMVYGKINLSDPTFTSWLLTNPQPSFRLKQQGRYVRHLGTYTTMVVYNRDADGPLRWNLGYEVEVPLHPDLPGNHTPTAQDLEAFALNVLWLPVMKSNRPQGWHRRLL